MIARGCIFRAAAVDMSMQRRFISTTTQNLSRRAVVARAPRLELVLYRRLVRAVKSLGPEEPAVLQAYQYALADVIMQLEKKSGTDFREGFHKALKEAARHPISPVHRVQGFELLNIMAKRRRALSAIRRWHELSNDIQSGDIDLATGIAVVAFAFDTDADTAPSSAVNPEAWRAPIDAIEARVNAFADSIAVSASQIIAKKGWQPPPAPQEGSHVSWNELEDGVRALVRAFHVSARMHGDQDDYYNVMNSVAHRVIERRSGNPITLSALFLTAARRVPGLSPHLHPVNYPYRFLVGVGSGEDKRFIDCFEGKILDKSDLRKYSLATPSSDGKELEPISPAWVFIRMLYNLYLIHQRVNDEDGIRCAAAQMSQLRECCGPVPPSWQAPGNNDCEDD